LVSQSEADAHTPRFNGSVGDGSSEGYEFRLVGNPTPNLTLVVGYSRTERTLTNAFRDLEGYLEAEAEFYADKLATVGAGLDDTVTTDGQSLLSLTRDPPESIADEVARVRTAILTNRAIRSFGFGEAPDKITTTMNYRFEGGPLKGLVLGGSVRWLSAVELEQVLDYNDLNGNFQINEGELNLDADGNARRLRVIEGDERFEADLMVRYPIRSVFGRKINLDLQLNVFNAFDNDGILPQRLNNAYSGVSQYVYIEPRSWRLTARWRF
jgi:outer membrane receptor protein involved in Fe transport